VLFKVAPSWPPGSQQAQQVADRIRGLAPPAGMQVHVAGLSAGIHDYVHDLYDRFPWIIGFVVVVTYLVLLMLLRSVLLPLKAVVVNTLSLLASFGAVVWVFQFGHLEWLLHFHGIGTVDADLPVILFCTVFGVSMDYEVFLLSRMREAWQETHDNQAAVSFGLTSTGRIVTSAALIIVVVAGSFAFTSIIITKAIGVGLAVAVALDASIVRILMVPAIMRLLGGLNWWCPRWLDRWLPRLGG
jgi:RND superfamily putative drug exporter